MNDLLSKIKTIQNKQRTLQWGHYQMSDAEIMFAVGNTAYPKEPHYFSVTNNKTIFLITDSHKREEYKQCETIKDVTDGVITLLKCWFPAK